MQRQGYYLRCLPIKATDCFIRLPPEVVLATRPLFQSQALVALRLAWRVDIPHEGKIEDKYCYTSFNGHGTRASQSVLEVPMEFARAIELEEGSVVYVEILDYMPRIRRVNVRALSWNDWELIHFNSTLMEENFLRQISVVYSGEVVPIHIYTNTIVRFQVGTVKENYGCLSKNTEVVIEEPISHDEPNIDGKDSEEEIEFYSNTLEEDITTMRYFRVQPGCCEEADFLPKALYECFAYVNPEDLKDLFPGDEDKHRYALVGISSTSDISEYQRAEAVLPEGSNQENANPEANYRRQRALTAATMLPSSSVSLSHVYLPSTIRALAGAEVCDLVTVKVVKRFETATAIDIVSTSKGQDLQDYRNIKTTLKENVLKLMKERIPVVLQDGSRIRLSINESRASTRSLDFTVRCEKNKYFVFDADKQEYLDSVFNNLQISSTDSVDEAQELQVPDKFPTPVTEIRGLQRNVLDILQQITPVTHSERHKAKSHHLLRFLTTMVIYGPPSCGKTTLAKNMLSFFHYQRDVYCFGRYVSCRDLVGLKMSQLLEEIDGYFMEAWQKCPSVIVFDDLDHITPSSADEVSVSAPQSAIIASRIQHWMSYVQHHRRTRYKDLVKAKSSNKTRLYVEPAIVLIATSKHITSLNTIIRGSQAFSVSTSIGLPGLHDRVEILCKGFEATATLDDISDVYDLASKMDGCTPGDLAQLANRIYKVALGRFRSDDRIHLTKGDIEHAMEGFKPMSLRSTRFLQSHVRWADVGGMRGPKAILRSTLEFPTKYSRLLKNVPLRLPTGILLYGPPGCGKTLIAGAVANECGLNFISVKGPEILDKYIGASEQAVRSLFERASSAAPCVLFFDEFDSIAPRRGSDNTGVTDRVVNQLLTFMDGIERQEGVYVLAATSRPDLIDPALLRPGRLDKQIYIDVRSFRLRVGLPSAQERREILSAHSRALHFETSALEELFTFAESDKARHFTGADLQGLLNTIAVNVANEYICEPKEKETLQIRVHHVQLAIQTSKSAMALEERAYYDSIYEKFHSSRVADFTEASSIDDGLQRTAFR